MDKRSIMIAFPGAAQPEEIQSDAETWGELKKELEDQLGQDFYNQKVRDHKTNHHYNDDNAVLAAEPIKLLVSTDKNKSGNVTKANYHKAAFSPLRTFAKKMTGSAPNGKQACLDALDEHYGKPKGSSSVAPSKKAPAKKEAPKKEAPKAEKVAPAKAKGKTVKEKVPATPKKGSIEDRVLALESAVFGSGSQSKVEKKADQDDFMSQARRLS